MGAQFEDSFGFTDYTEGFFGALGVEQPNVAFGHGYIFEFADAEPLIYGTAVTIPFKTGSRQFVGAPQSANPTFSMLGIGAIFMGNLIQRAQQSAINVDTLTMAAEDGVSSCDVVAPTGAQWKAKGLGLDFQNHTSNFSVAQEESFSMHTNIGAAGVINCTLPSGIRNGTVVGVMRNGPQINVIPGDAAKRIFMPASGYYKPAGQAAFMASSGSHAFFISNDNADWVPWFYEGTIN
jgi:hypothetical protein